MTNLEELALRCEQATGLDRELDAEIAQAVYEGATIDWRVSNGTMEPDPWLRRLRPNDLNFSNGYSVQRLPAYTASIDAALTLVPTEPYPELRPGKWWWLLEVREDESVAHIAYENHDAGIPEFEGKASTPTLALCAAALRAHNP